MITKKELATKLKFSERTIDRLRKDGLPCIKLRTGTVRFDFDIVMEWLKGEK